MLTVPVTLTQLIVKFAPRFSKRVWEHVQVLVTLEETRAHLGIETQRPWSDLAIGRTTPALFGLYSLVTLLPHSLPPAQTRRVRIAAWYAKPRPTFSDALAVVRRALCSHSYFSRSRAKSEVVEIPRSLLERLTDALCYAA